MSLTIVLIGTLDTKGPETEYARNLISQRGHTPLVIDAGMLGGVYFPPDVTRAEVAAAGGSDLESVRQMAKSDAVTTMGNGLGRIVQGLLGEDRIHGILGLGGGQGTVMATSVMKGLPFGFPKVMVSAVANGGQTLGPLVGTKDICIIHSVADVLGLNAITRRVIAEGVGAVTGMAEIAAAESAPETTVDGNSRRTSVAITSAGVTTPCVMKVKDILASSGYELIAFHCNGIGAEAMEDLAVTGEVGAVIDLSPKDIADTMFGGIFTEYPGRLRRLRDHNVPLVFVPGTLDFILFGAYETVPVEMKTRKLIRHNPLHTHVRATRDEMKTMGREVGIRLEGYRRQVQVLIPEKGFTSTGSPGGPINDPDADLGFREGLEEWLEQHPRELISINTFPYDINDPRFAEVVAEAVRRALDDV